MEYGVIPTSYIAESTTGLGLLGINIQSFVFQLITFILVLIILRRFVFTKIISTLEKRRIETQSGLEAAKQAEEALKNTKVEVARMITEAQSTADNIITAAQNSSRNIIAREEKNAIEKAQKIIEAGNQQLLIDSENLRRQLKKELSGLVIDTTEKLLDDSLDDSTFQKRLDATIKEISS